MSKTKQQDLSLFQDWLIEYCGLGPRSASVYASRVRGLLKRIDVITPDSLDYAISALAKGSRPTCQSGWNRFADFCRVEHGLTLPYISSKRRSTLSKDVQLPSKVCEALIQVKQEGFVPYRLIPLLQWKHIQRNAGPTWRIQDPNDIGLLYLVPADPLRTICDWANGLDDIIESRPMLPERALGMKPMPRLGISRILKRHKAQSEL